MAEFTLHRGQCRLVSWPRHELPEARRAQMKERHRQIAPPVQRHDQRPVVGKKFGQVVGWFDEIRGDCALDKEVDDDE